MSGLSSVLAHPLVAGLLVTTAATTASAALGTFVLTLRNHRLLTGEDADDTDDGLLGRVSDLEERTATHEQVLASVRYPNSTTRGGADGSD